MPQLLTKAAFTATGVVLGEGDVPLAPKTMHDLYVEKLHEHMNQGTGNVHTRPQIEVYNGEWFLLFTGALYTYLNSDGEFRITDHATAIGYLYREYKELHYMQQGVS